MSCCVAVVVFKRREISPTQLIWSIMFSVVVCGCLFVLFPRLYSTFALVQNKDAHLISLVLVSGGKETGETLISLCDVSRFNLREVRDGTLSRDQVILFYARDGGRISSLSPVTPASSYSPEESRAHARAHLPQLFTSCSRLPCHDNRDLGGD